MTAGGDEFEFLCRMGDNALVLGQRLSEWCGSAPALEEDIALANTALDLLGQAKMWLDLAAEVEDAGRTSDDLAMKRDVMDFRNLLLVERPNGDFGHTMTRQFLFDSWHVEMLKELADSKDARIAEISAKSAKEARYHVERSAETVIGLGDGTPESHSRMQTALNELWSYVGEMFHDDEVDMSMARSKLAPLPSNLRAGFDRRFRKVVEAATLIPPTGAYAHLGGKNGIRHTEHLGHILTQMQWLQRAYPESEW